MKKIDWKPGNMLYPLPAIMVSSADKDGNPNIFTASWVGTICTNPPMVYVSIRKERYSYNIIKDTKEFVLNLSTSKLVKATDYCGVKSGKDIDKWKECALTPSDATHLKYAKTIEECPVNIECEVVEIKELGSHDMFIANVVGVKVDEELLDANGKLRLNEEGLLIYSHGNYFEMGKMLGSFGYSVRKKVNKNTSKRKKDKVKAKHKQKR